MSLRGEFICGNGLILPNNITRAGALMLLKAALRNTVPAFWVGLVDVVPTPTLQIEDTVEPTIGTGDYARIQILRSDPGWPLSGEVNGESYLESDWLIWAVSSPGFDQGFRRMMLVGDEDALTGDVYAISAALPAERVLTPASPEADRKFKYRVYLR